MGPSLRKIKAWKDPKRVGMNHLEYWTDLMESLLQEVEFILQATLEELRLKLCSRRWDKSEVFVERWFTVLPISRSHQQ